MCILGWELQLADLASPSLPPPLLPPPLQVKLGSLAGSMEVPACFGAEIYAQVRLAGGRLLAGQAWQPSCTA